MTIAEPIKAKHYRPLVGFLTDTIDQSFDREQKFTQAIEANHVCDHGQLDQIRQRRDAAYRALERVLELILRDIKSRKEGEPAAETASENPFLADKVLDAVFSGDEVIQDLRTRFEMSLA